MGRRPTRDLALGSVAARRRLLLDMALKRARPGSGSADLFLRRRTAEATWPDLTGILAGLRWAVVGAVAARAYMPERSTQDLDVLVAGEVAQEVGARLERAQFQKVQELAKGASEGDADGVPTVRAGPSRTWRA
jgi:hypothetical protein